MKHATESRSLYSLGKRVTVVYKPVRFGPTGNPPVSAATDDPYAYNQPAQLLVEEKRRVVEGGQKWKWKPFEHYKYVLDAAPIPANHDTTYLNTDLSDYRGGMRATYDHSWYGVRLGSGTVGQYNPSIGVVPDWRTTVSTDEGFIPKPAKLVELEQAALEAIMPKIKAEFSVLNAVYELKDFKHLTLSAMKVLAAFRKLPFKSAVTSTLKLTGFLVKDPTKQSLSRLVAGGYLQWKFAVAPLISDIQATWLAVSNTEKKLRKLLDGAEKVRIGHFSVSFKEYENGAVIDGPAINEFRDTGVSGSRKVWAYTTREVAYQPSKFHVEIEYSYVFLDLQVAHSRLLAYLDAFGVNINPAIIWNAIPYTFLLDWVIGVSRFLGSLKAGWMDPVVFIHQYLWSITRERRITGRVRYPVFGSYVSNGQEYGLPVCVETAYRRETRMPEKSSFLTTSGLSPVELSLGAALVVTRRARRKYRFSR
jgi:hypothetical protein